MTARRLSVSLPKPVLDALYAEGSRTLETPGQVAARILRLALPGYVHEALSRDLAPTYRVRVIEVPTANDPGSSPRVADASSLTTNAEARVPPVRPELEPGGATET
jgi:hypothetical protein